MKDLSFWAQSLDNESPDVIVMDGEELSDDQLRQELVSEIYKIPQENTEVLPINTSVKARYRDPVFVIEAIPTEKDNVNRLAPIIIYGILPDDWSEIWIKNVCSEIENFVSSRLNRTLDGRALVAIQNWLDETLKKKMNLQSDPLYRIKMYLVRLVSWTRKCMVLMLELLRKLSEELRFYCGKLKTLLESIVKSD